MTKIKNIDQATGLSVDIIAEVVAEKTLAIFFEGEQNKWGSMSTVERASFNKKYDEEKAKLEKYLKERAETAFTHNKEFNKGVRSKGNGGNSGRDYLYMFMYHWADLDDNGEAKKGKIPNYQLGLNNWYKEKVEYNWQNATKEKIDFSSWKKFPLV